MLIQGLGLVFVAVYQRALKLLYVDELLERVKQEFSQQYKPDQVKETTSCLVF
jgi:signal recognition particle receptor subunit alpha